MAGELSVAIAADPISVNVAYSRWPQRYCGTDSERRQLNIFSSRGEFSERASGPVDPLM